jgi:hypothetical protein
LYNSGKLKDTHKVRMKFPIGNYEDCRLQCFVYGCNDVYHVLLGRPWQFDQRSTNEGSSNVYSLWHKGKRHVLKPMLDKDMKMDVFAAEKIQHIKAKPRTLSFHVRGGFLLDYYSFYFTTSIYSEV